jgi:hypothetical protein
VHEDGIRADTSANGLPGEPNTFHGFESAAVWCEHPPGYPPTITSADRGLLMTGLYRRGGTLVAPLTALAGVEDPNPEYIDELFGVRFGSPPPPSLERLGT